MAGAAGSAWCDEASVPADKRALFLKWAPRLVEFPSAERMQESLRLRMTDQLGTHMVAVAAFEPGDLVLSENALLRLPALSAESEELLLREFGSKAAFLAPALEVDWTTVVDEVREALQMLFWAHPLLETANNSLVDETREACRRLISRHKPLQVATWDTASLLRFLHVVDLNIHRDGEVRQNADFAGVFVFGSKFSNSCAPNCRWSFSKTGCLEYHAVRRIEPGELLTFSYIGNGLSLVEGTVARRRRLGNLWFVCQCDRCLSPDLSRQMWCPKCRAPSCVPGESPPNVGIDWTGDIPLKEVIMEPAVWKCKSCGVEVPAADMPLAAEEEVAYLVPQVMEKGIDTAEQDFQMAGKLINRIERTLGPHHWTRILAVFAWLQKALMLLRSSNVIDFHEKLLQQRSIQLAKWFEECYPLGVEQRLSVLCLAVRLSRNFNDDLRSWGYDPEDPFGNGLLTAKRMVHDEHL